jgi:ribulose-5-phosphate 4-epimerase/fuculose-1-phosphate aldolase
MNDVSLDDLYQELQAAGRCLLENHLTWGSAGYVTFQTGPECWLITASGTILENLSLANLLERSTDQRRSGR